MTSTASLPIEHSPAFPSLSSAPARPEERTGRPETIRRLGERLVSAQRPLRLLEAIRWDEDVERAFFASGCRYLPRVDLAYYRARPLPFDLAAKRRELHELERDVERRLGPDDAAGQLLLGRCRQYLGVVDLLEARGTSAFAGISARLFGSSGQCPAGAARLIDLARGLAGLVAGLEGDPVLGRELATFDAAAAADELSARLRDYFGQTAGVHVRLVSSLASEAAAGTDYLKLRATARFSERDLRLLEVHEGWVHLGTTLNGMAQPVCSFLARPTPAATLTQEGLAVLVEVLAFASHPDRLRRLAQRVEAVALAEAGADFLEVYRHFVAAGCAPSESYRLAARVFRGSLPSGAGPFTKDLAYSRGLVEVAGYLRQAIATGQARRIPLLLCGKVGVDEVPLLARLADEGLLAAPRHLPPPFADLRGLCAWLCCAGWLGAIDRSPR
jgi:uncharacterized protein (TIGR02421 family)